MLKLQIIRNIWKKTVKFPYSSLSCFVGNPVLYGFITIDTIIIVNFCMYN